MKKTILLATDGFEEIEALTIVDVLRRADVVCEICSVINEKYLTGSHNITVKADRLLEELGTPGSMAASYDAVILPGGMPGSAALRDNDLVIQVLQAFAEAGKITAAICAAPIALERAGLLVGKQVTAYPENLQENGEHRYTGAAVEHDGNVITGKAPGAALPFAYELVRTLAGEAIASKVQEAMYYLPV